MLIQAREIYGSYAFVKAFCENAIVLWLDSQTFFYLQVDGSTLRAAKGMPHLAGNVVDITLLDNLPQILQKLAIERGCKKISIRMPADYAAAWVGPLNTAFEKAAFRQIADRSFYLEIGEKLFVDTLPIDQRRILRKTLGECNEIRHVASDEEITWCYDLLCRDRSKKGFGQPLSFDAFVSMASANKYYSLYRLKRNGYAGMGLIVHVSSEVDYLYLTAQEINAKSVSPTLALYDNAYSIAKDAGKNMLDLGTAGEGGVEHPGVTAFKKSLNPYYGYKCTWEFDLGTS